MSTKGAHSEPSTREKSVISLIESLPHLADMEIIGHRYDGTALADTLQKTMFAIIAYRPYDGYHFICINTQTYCDETDSMGSNWIDPSLIETLHAQINMCTCEYPTLFADKPCIIDIANLTIFENTHTAMLRYLNDARQGHHAIDEQAERNLLHETAAKLSNGEDVKRGTIPIKAFSDNCEF